MTTPIVLSAIVGGGVSFLVVVLANFYRDDTRSEAIGLGSAENLGLIASLTSKKEPQSASPSLALGPLRRI